MQPILTTTQWLQLSPWVRKNLIRIFNIKRSSGSQILDTKVISDGHTHDDLQVINVTSMQTYLESPETDFYALFNAVLESLPMELSDSPVVERNKPIDIRITLDSSGSPELKIVDNNEQTNATIETKKEPVTEPAKASTEDKGTVGEGDGAKKGNGAPKKVRKGSSVPTPPEAQ